MHGSGISWKPLNFSCPLLGVNASLQQRFSDVNEIRSRRVESNGGLPGTAMESMGVFGPIKSKEPASECLNRGLDRCGRTTIVM